MATDLNITMKQYNGVDYDTLYPATTASQISGTIPVDKGGTGATNASGARANIGAASTATYTISVPTSWVADSTNGGYYQTIAVSGILSTDNPIADVVLGANITNNEAWLEAWALITRITTANNSITLWANSDAPTSAFTCQLKVVR